MSWLEALVLGIVQGLTEYLPVSSSGHLAIGSALFGIEGEENLAFTIVVHVATVFSTLVILWKEIEWIFRGLFKFEMNSETRYAINILISMIPIGIVGVFFKDTVEAIFGSGLLIVGCMLLVTAALLAFSYYAKPRQKENISMKDAFIIGLSQACAVLPGLSRSGTTIATGLLLGNNKAKLAQFSFLMVIPPILGEALLDILKLVKGEDIAGLLTQLGLNGDNTQGTSSDYSSLSPITISLWIDKKTYYPVKQTIDMKDFMNEYLSSLVADSDMSYSKIKTSVTYKNFNKATKFSLPKACK